jgi:isochorismate synthase
LLVSRHGDELRSRPLAGSSQSADGAALAALAASAKDHHEHAVVVDAMRAVFSEFAESVEVAGPEIVELADLGHLATSIRAEATSTTPSALGLALALHPTPAVAGTPTAEALAHIAALEGDRGRYAGPVGWVDAAGNGQFAVALRAAEIDDDDARRVTLRAGAGIVAGSDADTEWSEIDAKFAPILHALGVR